MSARAGRKDPTAPELKGTQCIFRVGLRKEWAQQCSYWIEIYKKTLKPTKKGTKRPPLFYVYRQWSFYKAAESKVVEGGYPNEPSVSLQSALDKVCDFVRDREEKGDVIQFVKEHDDHPGLQNAMSIELGERAAIRTKIPDRDKTTAEKFKETQLRREKEAKW